ncbi:E3 ubiquitin-protein ligase RNF186-like [Oryzias melastigma]|uniref:E3 ubiquitin-protein ligase RNF186-like n=1 Tax=Oryzias melastigma TaxID=30732 RepID=UPI00168CF594|nr:E3 ubiquitin-protein ligase RNF186-like [Oryzias melastigma]
MAETAGCDSVPPPDSSVPEEFECKVCFNDFDLDRHLPKLLGCSHTFCRECLEKLHSLEGSGWRVGCPVCRYRTPVREYLIQNLPDNVSLTDSFPFKNHQNASEEQTAPSGSTSASQDWCETCKHVAFTAGCVCANFSFLGTVVLLFLGLISLHNFDKPTLPLGSMCLLVAGILALLSLILMWLLCVLKLVSSQHALAKLLSSEPSLEYGVRL